LPIGTYVLEENKQAPEHDRKIADAVRVEVLERDSFACRVCKWTREKATRDDPRRLLELHHIQEHLRGGQNEAWNLVTLCNVDHDRVHAGTLDLAQFISGA
jgi:5-methylcytosine-specific restriction endonuclease McrA